MAGGILVKVPKNLLPLYEEAARESRRMKEQGVQISVMDLMFQKARQKKKDPETEEFFKRWRL